MDEKVLLGTPGGFGQVHPGFSIDGAPVAIKIFHPDAANDSHRELEFAKGRLGIPSHYVVPILDYGTDGAAGPACIVMARAERNLKQWLGGQPITTDGVLNVLTDVTRGLLEVGDWIHRDLKPENLLLLDGRWQIADFGIARLADATTAGNTLKVCLSVGYAAPEQFDAQRAVHETDVYSLGCIGFELLMGRPPFAGPMYEDFARQHRSVFPTLTTGSPGLRALLLEMMAKSANARPSLDSVLDRLHRLAAPSLRAGRGASLLAEASTAIAAERAREEAEAAAVAARQQQREKLRLYGQPIASDRIHSKISWLGLAGNFSSDAISVSN